MFPLPLTFLTYYGIINNPAATDTNEREIIMNRENYQTQKAEWLELITASELLFCKRCKMEWTNVKKLVFHHKDPLNKNQSCGFKYSTTLTIDSVYELICECEPLCHSCHRLLHLDMEACDENRFFGSQKIDTTPELTGMLEWRG